jgi:hypothetical protein
MPINKKGPGALRRRGQSRFSGADLKYNVSMVGPTGGQVQTDCK